MIRKKQFRDALIIDLTGPDGNAFSLLAFASKFAQRLGMDSKAITDEMRSGDYENLIATFDKYFGDYVILER